jgi:hypothetical protein
MKRGDLKRTRPFWEWVDKSGGPDACWPWTGQRNPDGYGKVTVTRRSLRAHRRAYELATGVEPGAQWVLHSCDNPPCCNPAHLLLGDHALNVAHRTQRGRNRPPKGAANGQAKLTDAQARLIYQRRIAGESRKSIAADFGIDPSLVTYIAQGKVWSHATR